MHGQLRNLDSIIEHVLEVRFPVPIGHNKNKIFIKFSIKLLFIPQSNCNLLYKMCIYWCIVTSNIVIVNYSYCCFTYSKFIIIIIIFCYMPCISIHII